MNQQFSIITSIYKNDKPEFVRIALDSMLVNQSVKPSEIVLVQDGPVSEGLSSLLFEYEMNYPTIMSVIRLKQNEGLGNALMLGVEAAKNEIVARMDSDDICIPNRFEIQLAYLKAHPEVDIIGGQMTEFVDTPDNIVGRRKVPLSNDEIYDYMKSRCALNHVTVMFRRSVVLKIGNYQDWFWNEDYYLWVRMMMARCKFANVTEVLVNVRSGANQYARRGGRKYYESEKGIKKLMLDNGLINRTEYFINVAQRYIIQILMPNRVRGWVYRTLARQ
ncbi:glycosyltransferase [Butyricimonas faecihominis]|uniref:glycosyltransferase n=1 Tax=Butyricimonas faecihominis TaxID=1472416 RepID=UPI0032C13F76